MCIRDRLYKEFPELQAEFKDVKLLWVSALPNYMMHSKKKVVVPEDVKGMKVGAAGAMAELINEIGGTAVNIPAPDAYMSLKTGVIDAQLASFSQLYVYKLWEVTDYHLNYGFGRVFFPIIMNKDAWNSLPADIQNLIMELAPQAMKVGAEGLMARVEKSKKTVVEKGDTIITPTPKQKALWQAAGKPLEDKWVADMQAAGHASAGKILARFKELAAESWK